MLQNQLNNLIEIDEIDVTKINEIDEKYSFILYKALKNNKEEFFRYDSIFPDLRSKEIAPLRIRATYGLLRRKQKHSDNYVYEIIGERIGSGDHSIVYKSLGYLALDHTNKKVIFKSRIKAVKHATEETKDKHYLINEYNRIDQANYLGVKAPVIIDEQRGTIQSSGTTHMYMVMRYIEGHTLSEVSFIASDSDLKSERDNKKRLLNQHKLFTADERIQISINLLNCVKTLNQNNVQVRDMHAGNIMINPYTLEAFVIDFGVGEIVEPKDRIILTTNISRIINHIEHLWNPDLFKSDKLLKYFTVLGLTDTQIKALAKILSYSSKTIERLEVLDDLIIAFEKLKTERLIERLINESSKDEKITGLSQDDKEKLNKAIKENVDKSIHEAYQAIRELNQNINSSAPSLFEQVGILMKHILHVKDDKIFIKIFTENLGIGHLQSSQSQDELVNQLNEISRAYERINAKQEDLLRIKKILSSCKKISSEGLGQNYDIQRIDNYLQYIDYLLHDRINSIAISTDVLKIEKKIDRLMTEIVADAELNKSDQRLFPFLADSKFDSEKDQLTNLELMHLKEKVKSVIKSYQNQTSSFFNSFFKRRSHSVDRTNDIAALISIIDNSFSKQELETKIVEYCKTLRKGLLGRSELEDKIKVALDTEYPDQKFKLK